MLHVEESLVVALDLLSVDRARGVYVSLGGKQRNQSFISFYSNLSLISSEPSHRISKIKKWRVMILVAVKVIKYYTLIGLS